MSTASYSSDSEDEEPSWETCLADDDYEICEEFPYQIRRKSNKRIVKETIHKSTGYVVCYMNNKQYYKHRIVAIQFIPNPENYSEVDHINRDRTDFRIENLRFVSSSENKKNRTSNNGVEYEYVDRIDDEAIEIRDYGRHHFEFYYYVESEEAFYYFTGVNYRKLHINIDKRNGSAFVYMNDTENKQVQVRLNNFKRLYGIDF